MASPPFNPSETVPGDTDVVANFPGVERTFRDVVESWLLFEHGRSGHHAFDYGTTAARDGDSTWEVGSLFLNSERKTLQYVQTIGPVVFGEVGFPTGTRVVLQQTSAPLGYTKDTTAALNDSAFRCVVGSATTGGTAAFSTTFAARTILQANLPVATLTTTITDPGHSHVERGDGGGGTGNRIVLDLGNASNSASGNTTSSSTTGITASTALGGSGTAMDFAVKFIDLCIFVKD